MQMIALGFFGVIFLGGVLLWLLLFGAGYLYSFDVPKWVNLALLGPACVKLLLDWAFTAWYRRKY